MPYIDRSGCRVYFTDSGEGPPLVLGHSLLCSGQMWAAQLPALRDRYRVINVDYRGHGQSGPAKRGLTFYDLLDDQIAILNALRIRRATWVGLSIGGMVALRAALEHPDRVAGLVVMDARSRAESRLRRLKYRAMLYGARLFGIERLAPMVPPIMFGASTIRERPALVVEWRQQFETLEPDYFAGCLDALSTSESITARLAEIQVPTLVMVGEEDTAQPPARSTEIADGIEGARLFVVPRAGHLSCVENPQAVTGAMLDFLSTYRW